jgi:hypothetical protein
VEVHGGREVKNREAIKMLKTILRTVYLGNRKFIEAVEKAISALEKQEAERWRRYPEEKPEGQEIVLATMPAYIDRNGDKHLYGGVICAYHTDSYRGGWWGRSDGVTYGALGMCNADPVAWRPLPEGFHGE